MRSRLEDLEHADGAGRPLVMFLGDDIDDEDHDVLFPTLREYGVSVIRVHPSDLVTRLDRDGATFHVAGRQIRPDLVVGWVLDELLRPGMAQLDVLERAGIPVINDALTLLRAQNKFTNSAMLAAGGALRFPVIVGHDPDALTEWVAGVDGPVVTKPTVGFGGRGLKRLDGVEDVRGFFAGLADDEPYYAVPWIDNPGRDIRVYLINHQPVFAMYRYAPEGKWITNVRAGGRLAMCPLTDEIAELAATASRAAGTLIGGVDVAENLATGELVVYEANSCPTCEPPVLIELAGFLAAAARDLDQALATWRPSTVYTELDTDPALFHESKWPALKR